jgi:hypothetical protein
MIGTFSVRRWAAGGGTFVAIHVGKANVEDDQIGLDFECAASPPRCPVNRVPTPSKKVVNMAAVSFLPDEQDGRRLP